MGQWFACALWKIESWTYETKDLLFCNLVFSYVLGEANSVADSLAKVGVCVDSMLVMYFCGGFCNVCFLFFLLLAHLRHWRQVLFSLFGVFVVCTYFLIKSSSPFRSQWLQHGLFSSSSLKNGPFIPLVCSSFKAFPWIVYPLVIAMWCYDIDNMISGPNSEENDALPLVLTRNVQSLIWTMQLVEITCD